MKLLPIKNQANQNVAMFNMFHLICVWQNGPMYNDSFTFEFTNNRKIQVSHDDALKILERAEFEVITF